MNEVLPAEDCALPCKHAIHLTCARQLRDPRCPMCRAAIIPGSCKLKSEDIRYMCARKSLDKTERERAVTEAILHQNGIGVVAYDVNNGTVVSLLGAMTTFLTTGRFVERLELRRQPRQPQPRQPQPQPQTRPQPRQPQPRQRSNATKLSGFNRNSDADLASPEPDQLTNEIANIMLDRDGAVSADELCVLLKFRHPSVSSNHLRHLVTKTLAEIT